MKRKLGEEELRGHKRQKIPGDSESSGTSRCIFLKNHPFRRHQLAKKKRTHSASTSMCPT